MMTWILLRGLTREARHWGRLPSLFGQAFKEAQLVPIDLPGNGAASHMQAPLSVAHIADYVRDVARQGARGPFGILAMSLGAMVATSWAQRYPTDITRLVLINTSMRPFSRSHQRLRPRAWPAVLSLPRYWKDSKRSEAVIHALTCRLVSNRDEDLLNWRAIREDAPVSAANAWRQLYAAARFRAATDAPQCATLLLSSANDGLVDPVCSIKLASAWRVSHRQHPWAGHDLPHDDPQWTVDAIRNWIAEPLKRRARAY